MSAADERAEHLLGELQRRYELTERFLAQVRPMVAKILSAEFDDAQRVGLLESLAHCCQHDLRMRRRYGALEVALQELFARLTDLRSRLRELR